ncbi:MAG: EAL domain-containing protein [Lachnospiraceae bacterium]|nr:EAL domain-containing protein [Lachnospiraceae bacterium]
MRKRIAVLLAQIEENTQKRMMHAFMKEAYAHDYDICVFSMYQKFQENEFRNIGDSNIFNLVQFDRFDGVLILLDTLQIPGLEKKILSLVKNNFHGPVIVADKECDEFEYVLMDHYTPLKALVNHLIEEHKITDIAYLGGKEGHPHSVQRYNGYLDALKEHGIAVREDRIRHGNYWYDSGHNFAEYLLSNRDDMPKAIVCANDYMAIGVASRISENGYRIPEDIAVVGYDTCLDGQTAPVPLTSAEIPADECGKQCFLKLHAAISGEIPKEEPFETKLKIGGSCGCHNFESSYKKINRDEWKSTNSEVSYFSDFNHITEDMLCQTDYEKFFEILAVYSYQIRPFTNFWMCFNDGFLNPSSFIGDDARRSGYSDTMHMVIKCGEDYTDSSHSCVDLGRTFVRQLMLPEIYEERDYPTTFIFTPMFFEDRSFGYAVYNHGPSLDLYSEVYRVWMRNVNQGIEAFYRQKALFELIERIKSDQIRDKQTGLYNYRGFYDKLSALAQANLGHEKTLAIIAFDLENLTGINEDFSREAGDSAIRALSSFLSRQCTDSEVCGRLSNDEFLVGLINEDCDKRYEEILNSIPEGGILYHDIRMEKHQAMVHHEMFETSLGEMPDLDFLINQTVNAKNHNKKSNQAMQSQLADFTEEEIAKIKEVERILNEHLLTYYFQPIVSAKNGDIYGYEALMRYEDDKSLTPPEILRYASCLERLYDVELNTFHGVLNTVENMDDVIRDKKIFINSLPAHQLRDTDEADLFERFENHTGQLVVEYTEGSELSDATLIKRKDDYSRYNIEVALDDYGSGYSNVNNLLRYTPNYVKIDRELISGIDKNEQKRHFFKSIVSYAKPNNIRVLAEGVETMEELRTVIDLGAELVQGFYTSRPSKTPVKHISEEVRTQIKRFSSSGVKIDY